MKAFANPGDRPRKQLPIHVLTAGYDHPQERRERPFGAEFHHVFIVERGYCIFETESGTRTIEAGTAVFIPKHCPHSYCGTDESIRTGWVTFDGPGVDGLLEYFKATETETCPSEQLYPQPKEFCRMIRQQESPERLSAELYRLIVSFFSERKPDAEPRLQRAKQFIRDRYRQDLSVDDVAKAAGISPSLLHRLFREEGSTPVEYLRQMRIRKAKELLLQDPKRRIGEIAYACGFSDFAYFCKVFRETEGISPKAFREKYRI